MAVTAEVGQDSDKRQRLLDAALHEFARFGFDGGRLERIAAEAGCAKRMLYYYFGNKEDVYLAVLERAYDDIRASEDVLHLDALPPREALHALARQSFFYHQNNADFTRLVLQENFQEGTMLNALPGAERLREAAFAPLRRILDRGAEAGIFRAGIEAVDVHFLISAISSFRVDHAYSWKNMLQIDLLAEPVMSRHLTLLLAQLDALTGYRKD
ncbi:TetR/AcrR family transcriptional regulator [Martelella alba]|uniref:TetR/AcrR family transcriptional regulator n=2 Tax=Martelella alba TaxID=2590451 RepID=A0A506U511_9HYPH|nr:TetR/AcrR family transcriptional regulator [Martelella alba]